MARRRKKQRMATVSAMKPELQAPLVKLPPKRESAAEGEEQGFFGSVGNAVMGGLRAIDDSTQAFARDHLLRLPNDGSRLDQDAFLSGPRQALGKSVFKARSGYEGDDTIYKGSGSQNDNIGLGLSRALQGGTITAAGASLVYLTNQFGNNAADYQEPNQLSL